MNRGLGQLVAAMLAFAATACTVGPKYVAPEAPASAPFRFAETAGQGSISDRWWDLFGDAGIAAHVEAVLAANSDLEQALARFDEARALLGLARADEYPVAGASPSWLRTRFTGDWADRFPYLDVGLETVPLSVAYEVDFWGKVRHATAAAAAQLAASRDAFAALRLSLEAETVNDLLQIRSLDRQADVLTRTVGLRQDALLIEQRRAHAGTVSDLDVFRARADLAQTQADLDEDLRRRELLTHALAVLEGRAAPDTTVATSIVVQTIPQVPAGLPSDLLRRRPDVAQNERQLAAASEAIGVAVSNFYPSLALTAQGGVQSSGLDNLFENQSLIWAIGPTVTLPLFDGGQNRSQFFAAQARYRESLAQFRKTYLQALREVQDALSDASFLRQRASHLQESREASELAAKLSRSRYDRGLVSYFEVVDSERSALGAQRAEIENDQQQLSAALALIKALGGGWSDAALIPAQPREPAPGQLPAMPTAIPPP